MINSKVSELVSHLANENLSEDELCEFLTERTFSFLNVNHCWISEVTNRKTVRARASYGVNQKLYSDWQEFPLDWKLPVTDALTEERLVWINSLPNWPDEYPLLKDVTYSKPVRTQIIIPILRFNSAIACLGIVTSDPLEPDEELELFFLTIANLLSLHLFRQARERKKLESPNVYSLTDRQIQILTHIANKKTNIEIGEIMGYSESTIRQETMRIFEKLQVHGRNEARAYFIENKERFGITSHINQEFAH